MTEQRKLQGEFTLPPINRDPCTCDQCECTLPALRNAKQCSPCLRGQHDNAAGVGL